jgi:hypothetical protein
MLIGSFYYVGKSEAYTSKNMVANWSKDLGTTQRSIFDPREESEKSDDQSTDIPSDIPVE